MSAMGQKRSFSVGQPDVRFAPTADIPPGTVMPSREKPPNRQHDAKTRFG